MLAEMSAGEIVGNCCRCFLTLVTETWLPHRKYQLVGSTGGRRLQYAAAGQAEARLVEEVLLQSLVEMAKEAFAGIPEAAACMFLTKGA